MPCLNDGALRPPYTHRFLEEVMQYARSVVWSKALVQAVSGSGYVVVLRCSVAGVL